MDIQIQQTYKFLLLLSIVRYPLIISGLIGLDETNISAFLLVIGGIIVHSTVYPYFGYRIFSLLRPNSPLKFIPLKRWMVGEGDRELLGHEYQQLLEDDTHSPLFLEKLEDVKSEGRITIFDVVNLTLFEEQIGKPNQLKSEDERLREAYRRTF